jgi:hypothetical protein
VTDKPLDVEEQATIAPDNQAEPATATTAANL